MSVLQVFILALIAILVSQLKRGRSLVLLGVSALVIYWLQPFQEAVNLTFWFPTCTLVVAVFFWIITSTAESRIWKANWSALVVVLGVVVFVDLNHYFKIEYLFAATTPRVQLLAVVLFGIVVIGSLLWQVKKIPAFVLISAMIGLVIILIFLKTPSALTALLGTVATMRGKDAVSLSEISWLGFSYVAFRLLHTGLDRKAGRLQSVSLADYVNYIIFFPAFTAGPIDRVERFVRNLNEPVYLDQAGWTDAGTRLFAGLFKKFVIADALAWMALNPVSALNVHSAGWLWIMLYAYALQIYFDFSGYTDIAIGLGMLLGVRLPENFDAPYLKPNLTQFWNSWHMTLTQWFRSYFFNPLTRSLRSDKMYIPVTLMILFSQVTTMMLIGLWHGVTINYFLWGVWHGVGLFVQNRWSDWARTRQPAWTVTQLGEVVLKYSGIFITFHFVTLGWVFFTLPDFSMALHIMFKLFGGV